MGNGVTDNESVMGDCGSTNRLPERITRARWQCSYILDMFRVIDQLGQVHKGHLEKKAEL